MSCTLGSDQDVSGQAVVSDVDIFPILTTLQITSELEGRLDGDFDLGGRLDTPRFELNGSITEGRIETIPFDSLAFHIGYDDGTLTVQTSVLCKTGRQS